MKTMTNKPPERLENVTVPLKANVYFGGKVVSHTLLMQDGNKKTAGLIYPGEFTFNTEAAEQMDILNGHCDVRLKGQARWTRYAAGETFHVPAKSAFDIKVIEGICEYLCSFQ
jgi:purine/pyrimidine-nucleoside phosphorylase